MTLYALHFRDTLRWYSPTGHCDGQGRERGMKVLRLLVLSLELAGVLVPLPTAAQTPPAPRVWLQLDDATPGAGITVTFRGGIDPPLRGVEYRFIFGDGAATEWLPEPVARHAYAAPGEYTARLDVRRGPRSSMGSAEARLRVQAAPPPTPPEPLRIVIHRPSFGAHANQEEVELEASVFGGRGITLVQVVLNGTELRRYQQATPLEVRLPLRLREGQNSLVIIATDAALVRSREARTVDYTPSFGLWLRPDKPTPTAWEPVRFEGGTWPPSVQAEYKIAFGDGYETGWLSIPEARHAYSAPGHYTARLLARRAGVVMESEGIEVTVQEVSLSVSLTADPERSEAGRPIMFMAHVEPPMEGLEYRFVFGDGQETGWMAEATTTHSYGGAGSFAVTVEVRVGGSRTVAIARAATAVAATPPTPLRWGLAGAIAGLLAVAAATYLLGRRLYGRTAVFQVLPRGGLEGLAVETSGIIHPGFEVRVRTIRGEWKHTVEPEGSLISGRGEGHGRDRGNA